MLHNIKCLYLHRVFHGIRFKVNNGNWLSVRMAFFCALKFATFALVYLYLIYNIMRNWRFYAGLAGMALTLGMGSPLNAGNHGRVTVHENQRFLRYEDGTPFFYLGDTAWELFHRLNEDEARMYLSDRARKGYTVIQAVVLGELDGLRVPNANGDRPFLDEGYSEPNERYFRHVDRLIDMADSLGLVVGLLPTWGDKINKAWGVGPVIFTDEAKAERYGRFLGERYRDRENIIWILGGDRDFTGYEAIVRAMARGVATGVGGGRPDYSKCLMTVHPCGGLSSSKWFHDDEWLDFNMQQNGHCYESDSWQKIDADYRRKPTKPVLDGEPLYDEHPICFDREKHGTSTDFHTRRYFYHEVFSGAFGHTQGCHAIWQMWAPGREPVNGPLRPWYESIGLAASYQMGYGRALMESRPFFSRIPAPELLRGQELGEPRRFSATRDEAGTYAMVYSEFGEPFSVDLSLLSGQEIQAWWFDVRSGKAFSAGYFPREGVKRFVPPTSGRGNDWVLVLDDRAKGYSAPGTSGSGM